VWFIAARTNKKILGWKYLFGACIALFVSSFALTEILASWQIKFIDPNFFSAFFFGIGIAKLFIERGIIWEKIESYSQVIGMVGLGLTCLYRFAWYDIIFLGKLGSVGIQLGYLCINTGLSCVVLSVLTRKDHTIKRFFRTGWLVAIGTISYSVYLTHFAYAIPLAAGLVLLFPNLVVRLVALPVFGLTLSFGVGLLYFYFFEKQYLTAKRINSAQRYLRK
jgi:peptidoglycan/LPS O-acetylase OafA/YrhL